MTENKNDNGIEPDRPAWAAGLDLSAERRRTSDADLVARIRDFTSLHAILRRLADAEMQEAALTEAVVGQATRIAELENLLRIAEQIAPQRGEPEFLIDRDGFVWSRTEPGRYRYHRNKVLTDARGWIDDNFGPVTEVWK